VEEFSFLQEKMILGSIARRYLSGTVEQLKVWYQKWILFGTPLDLLEPVLNNKN
jgi:hypothetical protein